MISPRKLEDELDEISRGEKEWMPLLEAILGTVQRSGRLKFLETVQRKDVTQEAAG